MNIYFLVPISCLYFTIAFGIMIFNFNRNMFKIDYFSDIKLSTRQKAL